MRGWQRAGIDCVAVTDHNTIAAGLALREWAPLRIIVASEVRTCEGEIIGLFLEEEIARGQTPEETIRHIRDQQGLVMIPHPFDRFRQSRLSGRSPHAHIAAGGYFSKSSTRARPSAGTIGVQKNWRPPMGWWQRVGSDSHTAQELGHAYVEMADFDSPQTFLDSLRAGRLVKRKSSWLVHASTRWTKLRSRLR